MDKLKTIEQIASRIGGKFDNELEIDRVDKTLIFEHRRASHFLAEVEEDSLVVTVPVTAQFRDHPEYKGDELVDRAMEELSPQLETYRERGYKVRETDWRPAYQSGSPYENGEDNNVPVFAAYLERQLGSLDELEDELNWLVEQLPEK